MSNQMTEWYKTGIRILMLLHRTKEGGSNRKDRGAIRKVSRNPQEFDQHLEELRAEKIRSQHPLRIYSSVNERNLMKAIRLYKMQQVELEGQSLDRHADFYIQTWNQFMSCLARPQCAMSTKFLIDVDSNEGECLESVLSQLEGVTEVLDSYSTPNGFHVITEPYNPSLTQELEIKKDGMLLLEW